MRETINDQDTTPEPQGQQGAFPLAAGSPLAFRLADCISYELGVELNAVRIQRELDASLGVLEINRLRTVNSVRREMLAMLNTTLANPGSQTQPDQKL